ncbi:MAG: hypothetical protein D8M59_05600 [Planctomycetes bacterium]|nr:hypothetical protein [Planctomycetota bacterium]NOG55945.1 hypothetical protein [Planctomycetota bacterium]
MKWNVAYPAIACSLTTGYFLEGDRGEDVLLVILVVAACVVVLCCVAHFTIDDLEAADEDHHRCTACDYILTGCESDRCPECGEPINPEIEATKVQEHPSPPVKKPQKLERPPSGMDQWSDTGNEE